MQIIILHYYCIIKSFLAASHFSTYLPVYFGYINQQYTANYLYFRFMCVIFNFNDLLMSWFFFNFIDSYIVAWKRGIAILSAGSQKVTPDPRVRLVNGYSLQIRDAIPQDAGDYICQIATMDPREITHTVEILSKC